MKSIREAVMSKEDPEEIKTQKLLYSFDSDRYDGEYGGYSRSNDYFPEYDSKSWKRNEEEEKKKIVITMTIDAKDIGKIADYSDNAYDPMIADAKAQEIAHDRLELLLSKNYELKHSISFDITEGYDEYDVEVTLIPIKK